MPGKVVINAAICKGCSLCVATCPKHVLLLDVEAVNDKGYPPAKPGTPDACVACGMCAIICPDSAISVYK